MDANEKEFTTDSSKPQMGEEGEPEKGTRRRNRTFVVSFVVNLVAISGCSLEEARDGG